jgi:hypothetical protein
VILNVKNVKVLNRDTTNGVCSRIEFVWEAFKINCLGGLREEVAREVRQHLHTNSAIRSVPQPFGYRMLKKFCGQGGLLFFLLRYLVLYAVFLIGCWLIITLLPGWVPNSDMGAIERSQAVTSYFLAAQAVMIGLLFPVAVGVITLITQREDASSTVSDLQVYYSESFAFGVGASGIALSIALAIHVFWPARYLLEYLGSNQAGEYFEVVLLIVHLLWLLLNFVALWHFLFVSLSFMRPAQRGLMRRRYAALVAVPADIETNLLAFRYLVTLSTEIAILTGRNDDAPASFVGTLSDRGLLEVSAPSEIGKVLRSVWKKPIMWAVTRWLSRCKSVGEDSSPLPKIEFHPQIDVPLAKGGAICVRNGGVPMTRMERLVIRHSFRFKGQ